MYESPITLVKRQTDNFIKEINEKTDEVIFKAVLEVFPQIDREELIKALQYDRQQYLKGYNDRDAEIIRCKDCTHFGYGHCYEFGGQMNNDDYCSHGATRESDPE